MAIGRFFTVAAAGLAAAFFAADVYAQGPTLGEALLGGVKKSRVVREIPSGPFGERGVLQRTMFLDVVGSNKNLEIAFVLDGTESMGQDIQAAVRSMNQFVDQLRRLKSRDANITFALVVYRDERAPSGRVTVPVDRFTANAEAFQRAMSSVKTETGAPWFQEQVDVGLHTALTKLPWSSASDKEYSRWIVLCGDARPYRESGDRMPRKYTNAELVRLATEKKVQIHTVICRSGFSNKTPDNAILFKTAKEEHPAFSMFANQLAAATGGGVLDLWDAHLVDELAAAAKGATQTFQRLEGITHEDVQTAKSQLSVGAPVAVAVLPHMNLGELSTDADRVEVQLATELRLLLNKAPQMHVKDAGDVAAAIAEAPRQGQTDEQYLTALGQRLGVKFLVWGEYAIGGEGERLATRLYRVKPSGVELVASAEGDAKMPDDRRPSSLTVATLGTLLDRTAAALEKTRGTDRGWVATFAALKKREVPAETGESLSGDVRAKRLILAGLERLEQTLSQSRQDATSVEASGKLAEAATLFEDALDFESTNPFTQLMLANASLNLAKHRDFEANNQRAFQALKAAYENREQTESQAVRQEIMADYALLVQKDFPKAAEQYEKLATDPATRNTRFALRAHWMLAGIYMGDWGVNEYEAGLASDKLKELGVVDLAKAREHIVAILAQWESTPQAEFYRRHIDTLRTSEAHRFVPPSQRQKQYVEVPVGQLQLVAY